MRIESGVWSGLRGIFVPTGGPALTWSMADETKDRRPGHRRLVGIRVLADFTSVVRVHSTLTSPSSGLFLGEVPDPMVGVQRPPITSVVSFYL